MEAPLWGRFSLGEQIAFVTALLLLAVGWLLPLHFLPWVSWHGEVAVFGAVLILGGLATMRCRTQRALSMPSGALLFAVLGALVVVQWMAGQVTFGGDAIVLVLYLALCATCWMLGFSGGKRNMVSLLEILAWLLIAMSVLSALIALVQAFEVWEGVAWIAPMPSPRRPGANLAQPNHLATLLLMGGGSTLFLFERRRISAITLSLILATLAIGLAVTESRTGLLGATLLAAWAVTGKRRHGLRLRWLYVLLAWGGLIAAFWCWPLLMSQVAGFGPAAKVNTSAGLRLVVWPQLLEALWMKPWFGWGLRELSAAHNAVAHVYPVSEPFTYAHNLILDLLIGLGVPLTVLLCVAVAIWVWRRLRATSDLLSWYCIAAVLPVAVHSMLEFPHAYAYFLAPATFLLGVLDRRSGIPTGLRVPRGPLVGVTAVVALVAAWTVVEYLAAEEDFRIVRFEDLRVGQTPADYERPTIRLLTQLDALLQGGRIVPEPGMSPQRMELARRVALRFPWPATQKRYALSLALNGEPEEALRQLRVIRALHGEKVYQSVKTQWLQLSETTYPQLATLPLP